MRAPLSIQRSRYRQLEVSGSRCEVRWIRIIQMTPVAYALHPAHGRIEAYHGLDPSAAHRAGLREPPEDR